MSHRKNIVLDNFRKESANLADIENRLSQLQTTTKKKLQQFSDSSKKSKQYADHPYNLHGVRQNLFETTFQHLSGKVSGSSPPRSPKMATDNVIFKQRDRLRHENECLKRQLQQSPKSKLEQQIELLEAVRHLEASLRQHLSRKLSKKF